MSPVRLCVMFMMVCKIVAKVRCDCLSRCIARNGEQGQLDRRLLHYSGRTGICQGDEANSDYILRRIRLFSLPSDWVTNRRQRALGAFSPVLTYRIKQQHMIAIATASAHVG